MLIVVNVVKVFWNKKKSNSTKNYSLPKPLNLRNLYTLYAWQMCEPYHCITFLCRQERGLMQHYGTKVQKII